MSDTFVVKDSGERKTFSTGMMRDGAVKPRYNDVLHGPMLKRWGAHLWKAKTKYPNPLPGVPNWTLAGTAEELERAYESLFGHFLDYMEGKTDEDHAAAIFFNINLAEHVKLKLADPPTMLQSVLKKATEQYEQEIHASSETKDDYKG